LLAYEINKKKQLLQMLAKAFSSFLHEYRSDHTFEALPGAVPDQVPGVLGNRKVDRSSLQALKVLGSGAFGKVWLADYKVAPSGPPIQTAVKLMRGGASPESKVCLFPSSRPSLSVLLILLSLSNSLYLSRLSVLSKSLSLFFFSELSLSLSLTHTLSLAVCFY
jgi:hypothetical protein